MPHALLFNNNPSIHQRLGGVYRIATILRENGWDIEVLDWVSSWSQEELEEFTNSRVTSSTVFIGFGCFFSYWSKDNDIFLRWFKTHYPEIVTVVGASSRPPITSGDIDYFVFGFGERAILALAAGLVGNTPAGGIKFEPQLPGRTTQVIDANANYPAYPMKSLMIKYEDRDYIEPTDWLSVEFGRGCMFNCLYCNFPVLGVKEDFSRDADNYVLQLTDAYDRFGVTNYFAADETFNDRTSKLQKFADVTDQIPFKPFISGFIRADLMVSRPLDQELLVKLGFLGHFYGVETFNHASGKAVGKGMDPDKLKVGLLEARKYFKSHGDGYYRGLIALVIGLPHETKESAKAGIDWITDNWQGESFIMAPLEIPIDSEINKLSKLSSNWSAFGYEEMPVLPGEHLLDHTMEFNRGFGRKNLEWKNEFMDVKWARKFSDDYYKFPFSPGGLNPWKIDALMHTGNMFSLKESLAIHIRTLPNIKDKILNSWHIRLQMYKAKKLGCAPEQITSRISSPSWYSESDDFTNQILN